MNHNNFHKILVANRGEIALRIIRAIQELDKIAVCIYSDYDKYLPYVTEADEAYSLGHGDLTHTYLNARSILDIAATAQVDAIHPGYGFLAENFQFAEACRKENIHFIGPDPEVILLMGHKSNARGKAMELGIPVLEGVVEELDKLVRISDTLPYPVLIKPAAGGGGKGMRIVHSKDRFEQEAIEAAREAENYFGSRELYVERYLQNPRHIEVQIIADHHGNIAHLFERECSLQRRYQKIIEEAPSSFISGETRKRITAVALQLARGIGYTSAGTIEFLMDSNQEFYFLEMNTRIQVEHPVTEMITNIDLVKEQITIAEGHPLSFDQQELSIQGHSIEARIYAENPENNFLPSTGRIDAYEVTVRDGARIDSGFRKGNLVEPYYDPMLAKVIVKGKNRDDARNQLIGILKDIRITGLKTNRDFLIGLLRSPGFRENRIHTGYIDQEIESLLSQIREDRNKHNRDFLLLAAALISLQTRPDQEKNIGSPWHTIGHWRILPEITLLLDHEQEPMRYELQKGGERMKLHLRNKDYQVTLERRVDNNYWIRINHQIIKFWGITDRSEVLLDLDGHQFKLRRMDILDRRFIHSGEREEQKGSNVIIAPLNGRIVQINVKLEDQVTKGDSLAVIESMKMENKILAPYDAKVEQIEVAVGEQIQTNQVLIILDHL